MTTLSRLNLAALFLASTALAAPLTYWRYGGGDQHGLQDALDCAIGRMRAATCLPVDVSYAPSHWVRFTTADDLPGDDAGYTWGPSWDTAKTKILGGMSSQMTCDVLVHEISHTLRRSNGHVGTGVSSSPFDHGPHLIDTATLDAVCAVQICGCYIPETTPPG